MNSSTQTIAEFICGLRFDQLAKEVTDNIKNCVLDAIGNVMGGLSASETKAIYSAITIHDQTPGATIWGIGKKVSVANAAFVNAVANDGWDFSAAGADASIQTTVVPAAVAMAEEKKIDGKRLIAAITAGLESQWRVAMALDSKGAAFRQKGFYITSVSGALGAAAACSKILNLDKNQTAMALGLGASEALGPRYCAAAGGVRGKVLFCGISAYMGLMAAYMAKEGLTSVVDVMEADQAFLTTFSDSSKIDMTTWKLGEEFFSKYLCYKLYPCVRYIHPYLDAVLKIRREHNVKPENIEKMAAYHPPEYSGIIRHGPPKDIWGAQSHLAWTVAAAIIDGEVMIDTYTEERLKDPQVWELAQKLEYIEDPKMKTRFKYTALPPFAVPGDLKVRMKDGSEYMEKVEQPSGVAPATYEDIYKKFVKQAGKVVSKDRIEQIAETCKSLERLEDISELVQLTVP